MRTIGVATVGRSDYGIYRPVVKRMAQTPGLRVSLFAGGSHWEERFGRSGQDIEKDGFPVLARIACPLIGDSPAAIGEYLGKELSEFSKAFAASPVDLLLVLGDRSEMLVAALAASVLNIPIAHIHGGEITEGAIDNAMRFSISRMASLHFTATEEAAARLCQTGEEPWRVMVSGAPGLDALITLRHLSRPELSERIGLPLDNDPILVTYHPVTLEPGEVHGQVQALLEVLQKQDRPIIITAPNADAEHLTILKLLQDFTLKNSHSRLVAHLGTEAYFSLMAIAGAMVGNSSSGLIEAPSFHLPVVNIGSRQRGRLRAENVIDVGYGVSDIRAGLERALSAEFRKGLERLENPYGDGHAAERIVECLRSVPLDQNLKVKQFIDGPLETYAPVCS